MLIIAYPFLAHWAVMGGGPAVVWAALMVPALVILLPFLRRPALWAWAGAFASAALAWGLARAGAAPYLLYLPPVLINLMLLAFFCRGLLKGPALVTRMAEIVRGGPLADEVVTYTRRVTWVWVALFASMALANTLLALVAPREVWSLFANFINYIILGSVFVAEYAIRRLRFPRDDHPSFFLFLRRIARIDYRRLGPVNTYHGAAWPPKMRPAKARGEKFGHSK